MSAFNEISGIHEVPVDLSKARKKREALRVSWQRVTVIAILVAGAIGCAALGETALATLFGGAAAGAIIPGFPVERNGGK